ncbi:MAG TPA: phosphoribosyltransferase family protein [Burkholderiales bacterium]|nr:phosphoribosyltransferase family protein [Burkholderiales bacterium]
MKFTDRAAAGRALAGRLQHYAGRDNTLVLALPPGGVPVAVEVARNLEAPLDVLLARKLPAELGVPPGAVTQRIVILVDDGLASGATMRAAAAAVRRLQARRIVIALPVAAAGTCAALRGEVDELLCLRDLAQGRSVEDGYEDFSLPSDEQLCRLLRNGTCSRAPHEPS